MFRLLRGKPPQIVARGHHVARDKVLGCPWRDLKRENFLNHFPGEAIMPEQFRKLVRC
jgi:hypothetical protein